MALAETAITTPPTQAEPSEVDLPVDIGDPTPLIELAEYDRTVGERLVSELGVDDLVAQVLVRRGLTDVERAAAWLAGSEPTAPELLPGGEAGAAAILEHLRRGSRIVVHGDYDVDGVCSTAIVVRTLARLEADVTWHVPSRFDDGYGLTNASVERLAARSAELIIAVDCGIGSVDEVAHARSLGVDVVICDHHKPGATLPDAPIVHPALGDYHSPELCASGAAFKLAQLLTAAAGGDVNSLDDDLALVALATVCDVVPLERENRALVRTGLEHMRTTRRPGLAELMRVAGVDPMQVTAESCGFALGPRINAAGRMHSAEPAVELMLTEDRMRAAELATGLARANEQRRAVEREILTAAETQARTQRDRHAIVVAGEGWHPGVLGIVAGRLAEQYHRPAVALSIDDGVAAGSGRAGGSYDLHGGLSSCSDLLIRFGGHAAAAGLALEQSDLPAFREALVAHAAGALAPEDLRPHLRVDAIVSPQALTLESVEQLARLGPFGAANPEPTLLLAGVELISVERMGRSGLHYRLGVEGGGVRGRVVAFRQARAIRAPDAPEPVSMVVGLQRNEFNGRVEAQAVLRALLRDDDDASTDGWREHFAAALESEPVQGEGGLDEQSVQDHRGTGVERVLLELAARGRRRVGVVANDPRRAARSLALLQAADWRLSDFRALAFDDPALAGGDFEEFVLAEPPPAPAFADFGDVPVTFAWGEPEVARLAARSEDLLLGRDHVVAAFRAVRDAADPAAAVEALKEQLPDPRLAGKAVRVLEEINLARVERAADGIVGVSVCEEARSDLELSFTFRSYSGQREASERWIRQLSTAGTPR